ncbi:Rha family transcriptional regulator [Selenomonas bovis]|uniref:Rha family transcriptional regulator n=1 Tax=Selenomonas bovis TaxID=416586 RepID=UPI000366C5EA|nr:Rha family transcriptional regulator [Selenomonas bovis]
MSMSDLVRINSNQVVTDSRSVAEHFEKQHKHVLEAIDNLVAENSATKNMFYETSREYRGQSFRYFLMNRDGFSLLVMGFTGAKAFEWKIKYINAFNEMEKSIKTPQLTPNPHYRTRMIGTAIRDVGKTSEELEKVFGVAHGMALAVSMNLVGEAYGVDMAPCKALLPAAKEVSYLNASGVAERIGLKCKTGKPNGAAANQLLAERGLQEKRGGDWHLTEKGKRYGEAKPYERGGHSGYQIMWSDKVIAALQ